MAELTLFSYLPNPRVYKATIAARLTGVDLDIVGAAPAELASWLWDPQPRPLAAEEQTADSPHARQGRRGFTSTLYKTDAFLDTQPFGTVPAAFGSDAGTPVGIFESNSILRAVARAGNGLYGTSALSASRIDSFLDANLVFAREAQVYLLDLQSEDLTTEGYQRMQGAYEFYLAGINSATSKTHYLVDNRLSIADISFACDFTQFQRELYFAEQLRNINQQPISIAQSGNLGTLPSSFNHQAVNKFPHACNYLERLLNEAALAEDLESYVEDLRGKLQHQQTKRGAS